MKSHGMLMLFLITLFSKNTSLAMECSNDACMAITSGTLCLSATGLAVLTSQLIDAALEAQRNFERECSHCGHPHSDCYDVKLVDYDCRSGVDEAGRFKRYYYKDYKKEYIGYSVGAAFSAVGSALFLCGSMVCGINGSFRLVNAFKRACCGRPREDDAMPDQLDVDAPEQRSMSDDMTFDRDEDLPTYEDIERADRSARERRVQIWASSDDMPLSD